MKKVKRVLRRTRVRVRLYRVRFLRWWHRNDKKYTWRWRVANGAVALLLLVTIVMPVVQSVWERNRYTLSAEALQLTGHTDPSLAKQLTYDADKQLYQFNKEAVSTGNGQGLPAEIQKASVGASDKSNTKSYSLDIPKDFTQGVTYHDTNSQLSFKLVPQFKALPGKTDQGHLVFPIEGNRQAVYTLKNNGLKEDIIVPEVTESTMRFDYTLELPKTMEVRAIPDSGGAIGIYAADPSLFGGIQYGSDKDRQAVEKARINANKTYLVFGLPAPVVKDTDGKEAGSARFELNGNRLSVVAEGLKASSGPITIDPSVVVTSTSDFQTNGNNEGMIDFGTSGQITRGGLTGGTVGSWGTTTAYGGAVSGTGVVAYNGYIYVVGGHDGSLQRNSVEYASVNSNGTVGTWTATSSLTDYRAYPGVVAYNGFLYAIGGSTTGWSLLSTAEYAKINSDGTVGTWQTTSSLPSARGAGVAVVSNGYVYMVAGTNGSNQNTTLYAKINADGTLGSWASTSSFTTARQNANSFAYNGYLYVMAGYDGSSTYYNNVQYARINNDGTVGTWATTTGFTTARAGAFVSVYNGYVYLYGGSATINSGFAALSDTQYALLNANGTLGTWRTTTAMGIKRASGGSVAYNGYIYSMGGTDNSVGDRTVQYAAIDRAGKPVAFGTLTNNFTTARALACSVAYNGYLYVIGGSTSDSNANNIATIRYTALNSSTGNNSSWSTATALPAGRGSSGCVAHNGYLYVIGGYTGSSVPSKAALYIAINSDGSLGASWTTSGNSLPSDAEFKPGVFVYGTSGGSYLYVLGGCDSIGTTCDNTYSASLNASTGAVGVWGLESNSMINQYKARGYAQVGKYLYAYGGFDGSTVYSATEYTSINNDGSINAWASTTSMNSAVTFTSGTTVNGCIYQVGGENPSGTMLSTVQYACPAANGTISAWYNAPNLTVATTDMGVASYNGYIYGVGGYTTSVQTTTQYAYVNHGGSGDVGSWSSGSTFTTARYMAGATAYNGYLYVAGGHNSSSAALSDVQYAPLTAGSGAVGSFTTDSAHPFTTVRMNFSLVAYNGYMYVMAGSDAGSSTFYKDTQYAPIGSSGALSGSFTAGTDLDTTGRESPCALAYNGYMYVAGGLTSGGQVATVRYAAINSDGSLGTWSGTTSFTTARYAHKCFVANGYFYILGGTNGSTNYNDVQAAPINSNGTLGSFVRTAAFNTARGNPVVGVANGFVYVAGGCTDSGNDDDCTSASSALTDVQYAPVYPGGTLGTWQSTTVLSAANGAAAGTVYDGYLYLTGGNGSTGTPVNTTSYAPLNSNPRTARYSKLIDLGNPVSISSVTYNGVLPMSSITPGVTPIYFRAAGSDKVFGSVTASGAITAGATACLATSQNYVRYLEVTILLDGSGGQAILPDTAGTLSNVTDFTVNYITPHPAPNIRLRHGQTLQTGNLSPLDTCYP